MHLIDLGLEYFLNEVELDGHHQVISAQTLDKIPVSSQFILQAKFQKHHLVLFHMYSDVCEDGTNGVQPCGAMINGVNNREEFTKEKKIDIIMKL